MALGPADVVELARLTRVHARAGYHQGLMWSRIVALCQRVLQASGGVMAISVCDRDEDGYCARLRVFVDDEAPEGVGISMGVAKPDRPETDDDWGERACRLLLRQRQLGTIRHELCRRMRDILPDVGDDAVVFVDGPHAYLREGDAVRVLRSVML